MPICDSKILHIQARQSGRPTCASTLLTLTSPPKWGADSRQQTAARTGAPSGAQFCASELLAHT
eukprot:6738338-Pyramimonas_sp.AAC.2